MFNTTEYRLGKTVMQCLYYIKRRLKLLKTDHHNLNKGNKLSIFTYRYRCWIQTNQQLVLNLNSKQITKHA